MHSGIELAPIAMPLGGQVYRFPALPMESFHGLAALLADSLPDRYGNALIDAWLVTKGRRPSAFNVVERQCYTGWSGMGGLAFAPTEGRQATTSEKIDIDDLVRLTSAVLAHRIDLQTPFAGVNRAEVLREIQRVRRSASGARAKAIIGWNPATNEVRSGHRPA